MSSKTTIANLALGHLSNSEQIANVESESSAAARACNAFYDIVIKRVFVEARWPFAQKTVTLGLVEESPNQQWAYSYQYPNDCLEINEFVSGAFDTRFTSYDVPHTLGSSAQGTLIYLNLPQATITYTSYVQNVDRYPADFMLAASLLLAFFISPRVTAGDPFKLGERALKLYEYEISKARARAINEIAPIPNPENEYVTIRG